MPAATLLLAVMATFGIGRSKAQSVVPPTNSLAFAVAADRVMEGEGLARIMVVRSTGTRGKISVDVVVTNDPGKYTTPNFTTNVTLNDLQLSSTITIPIIDNTTTNTNSASAGITFELKNPTLAPGQDPALTPGLGLVKKMVMDVYDDDVPQAISFQTSNIEGNEGRTFTFTVKLGAPAAQADLASISVDYRVRAASPSEVAPGAEVANVSDLSSTPVDDTDVDVATGTLNFDSQGIARIQLPVRADQQIEFNEEFIVELSNPQGDADDPGSTNDTDRIDYFVNALPTARGRILFNADFANHPMPAGAVDQGFNPDNVPPSRLRNPGANGPVTAVAADLQGNYFVAGNFSAVNATIRHGLAKLTSTGTIDPTFVPSQNVNGAVTSLGVFESGTNAGKVVIGGGFTSVNGQPRSSIARYLPNGSLDPNFAIGLGANGPIYAVQIEEIGSMIVAGNFTSFDGVPRGRIARLNPDGTLDQNSFTGPGANASIFDLSVEDAAPFTFSVSTVDATNAVTRVRSVGSRGGVLQLTYNTELEGDFFLVKFGNQTVLDQYLTNDIVSVTNVDGTVTTNTIPQTVRFNLGPLPSFPNDLTITVTPGSTNATSWSYTAVVQPAQTLSVVAVGDFTEFDQVPVSHVVKLGSDGGVDGVFASNIGTAANGAVQAVDYQTDGSYIIGGSFTTFNSLPAGGIARLTAQGVPDLTFAAGSGVDGAIRDIFVDRSSQVDRILIAGDFQNFNGSRRIFLARLYPDGYLDTGFMDSAFNQFAGFPSVSGLKPDGTLSSVTMGPDGGVFVGGLFDLVGGGGKRDATKPRQNFARLVGGVTPGPGNITFDNSVFGADEDGGALVANLTLTDSATNTPVMLRGLVGVRTEDASALAGQDYTAVNAVGTVTPTVDRYFLNISIIDEVPAKIEGDEEFFIRQTSIIGVHSLGGEIVYPEFAFGPIRDATARIIENDVAPAVFQFSLKDYNVDENRGVATIEILRTGNINDRVTVDFSALVSTNTNAASVTVDFFAITNQLVVFASGETNKTVQVTVRDDQFVEVDETIALLLSNPSIGSILDTNNSTATLNLIDNDLPAGKIDFTAAGFAVSEGQPFATVTLIRTGGNLGFIALDYEMVDDTAINGVDYLRQTGRLTWNDRDIGTRTVTIPILNDGFVEPLERFRINLKNPTQAGIIGTRNPSTFVTIADDDFYGSLQFASTNFIADENGQGAVIQVVRRNGSAESVSVNYETSPGTNATTAALPGTDYTNVVGTLFFGPGETAKSFVVPISDDQLPDGTRIVRLTLSSPTNGTLGAVSVSQLSIVDNELENIPAGGADTDFTTVDGANGPVNTVLVQDSGSAANRKIIIAGEFTGYNHLNRNRVARLNNDGSLDRNYANNLKIDATVRAMTPLPDGGVIIGGHFTSVDDTPANHLAKLNIVGHLDTVFKTGSGADNTVFALATTFAGNPTNNNLRILIGGDFVNYNNVERRRIAMLQPNGTLDISFNPGTGPNGTVLAIAVQRDQKIIIGGDFTLVGGVSRPHIARLNIDGTLDSTFNPGMGFDSTVRSIVVQMDDRILVGGDFQFYGSTSVNRIARLDLAGGLDITFNPGTGADSTVNSIVQQTDGKIVLGGNFTTFNGFIRPSLVRLQPTGEVDLGINFGAGPNGVVNTVAIQSDRSIVIGGGFTEVDGIPRLRVARVFGGTFAGSGALEFAAPSYKVNELDGTATVVIRRTGGNEGTITATYETSSITAIPGDDYIETTNTVVFGPGQLFRTITVPILDDFLPESSELFLLSLRDALGGAIGRQPVATVEIESDDSLISFVTDSYIVNENAVGGRANILVTREGVSNNSITVQFSATDGTAISNGTAADYQAVSTPVVFAPGETNKIVSIVINDDLVVEGDESVNLALTLATPSPSVTLGLASSVLTIADNDTAPGTLEFSAATTSVDEGAGTVTLTITRSAGRLGAVSVNYTTENGTAQSPSDYGARSGTITFQQTDTAKTIVLPVENDGEVEGNETFRVRLSNPTNGAILGTDSTATVVIVDNDFGPGSLDQTFDVGTGVGGRVVYAMVRQPDDKIVIGGDFTTFNGSTARNVARVLPTGARDTSFSVGSGPEAGTGNGVFALGLASQGRITVGGKFRSFASQDELFITRITTNGGLDTTMSFSADLNNTVRTIATQPDTKIVVGGAFTFPTTRAARINSSGSLDVSFNIGSGANNDIFDAAVQADGAILLGGAFTDFGGVPRGRIVRVLSNGLVDLDFLTNSVNNGANGDVRRILPLTDGKILVGGDFTSFNGQSAVRILRLNADGSRDTNFNRGDSGPNGVVNAIAIQTDGKVLIAGDFTSVDGQVRNRVARFNADGTLDDTFKPGLGPNLAVYDIEIQPDRKILIAGAFTDVNGFPRSGIARLNADELLPDPFPITSFQVVGGDLQLAFTSVAGVDYIIQESTDLNTGVWTNIRTITASGPSTTATGLPTGGSARFFRVIVAP